MAYIGSCHCGGIVFEVDGDITEVIDCNCSMCRRRGGLIAFVPSEMVTLRTSEAAVSTYQFHKHVIQHHFCAVCGIAPYGEGDGMDGPIAAINVRCLPDVDLDSLVVIKVDGKQF